MQPPLIQTAIESFWIVFSWPNILYPFLGTLVAMLFSLVPGMSCITLMALAVPITLLWDPIPALLLFGSLVGAATFMGSISAILFNIPGSASNAATVIDGYPMACGGEAKTAIACSASASALGSTFGIIILITLLPVLRHVVLLFGPPELLMLTIWGLITIASVRRGATIKGIIAGGIGFSIAFIGMDPRTGQARFTFGLENLYDGFNLVPILLGIFAVAEIIGLMSSRRSSISGEMHLQDLKGSVWLGLTAPFRYLGLFLRCSVIGSVIGMIPGIGGTVASFIAYSHATEATGKGSNRFGHGDIRGVLAPEAANDAKDGGSLIPTLAFGIPGSEGAVMLLAVLAVHGIIPGEAMLTGYLNLVFVLIWSLFLSNWLTSLIGLSLVFPLSWLSVMPLRPAIPVILCLVVLGSYMASGEFTDIVVAFFFGLVGYAMKRNGWPRVPLVMALMLAPLFEANYHLTRQLHDFGRIDFWGRPIVILLLALSLISLVTVFKRSVRRTTPVRQRQLLTHYDAWISISLLLWVGTLLHLSADLSPVAGLVPRVVLAPVALMLLILFVMQCVSSPLKRASSGHNFDIIKIFCRYTSHFSDKNRSDDNLLKTICWIALLILLLFLFGFLSGMPLFFFLFFRFFVYSNIFISLIAAALSVAILWGTFHFLLTHRLYSGFVWGLL